MSKSLKETLTAVIGPLLHCERPGRRTQRPQGDPMHNEFSTLAVKDRKAVVTGEESRAGAALTEAVGHALGYTEKEFVLAARVLDRFAWRYPAEPSRKNLNSLEAEVIGPLSGRNQAA